MLLHKVTFKNKKAIDTLSRFLAAGIWDGNVIISIIENPCRRGHSRAAPAPREEKSERRRLSGRTQSRWKLKS